MAFRRKKVGIEKKRENLIPPIEFPIMGIFHTVFLPNNSVLTIFLNPVEWMLTEAGEKSRIGSIYNVRLSIREPRKEEI